MIMPGERIQVVVNDTLHNGGMTMELKKGSLGTVTGHWINPTAPNFRTDKHGRPYPDPDMQDDPANPFVIGYRLTLDDFSGEFLLPAHYIEAIKQ